MPQITQHLPDFQGSFTGRAAAQGENFCADELTERRVLRMKQFILSAALAVSLAACAAHITDSQLETQQQKFVSGK